MEASFDPHAVKHSVVKVVESTILSIFILKTSYDSWKLAKCIRATESGISRIVQLDDIPESDLPSLIGSEESKQQDQNYIDEEKQEQSFEIESLAFIEEKRIDALKCWVVSSLLLAASNGMLNKLLDPSVELFLVALFTGVSQMQPKLIAHIYDDTVINVLSKLDVLTKPMCSTCANLLALVLVRTTSSLLRTLSAFQSSKGLSELSREALLLLDTVKSEERRRNFEELRSDVVLRETKFRKERLSRLSSAF
jgi:hypothetical protein